MKFDLTAIVPLFYHLVVSIFVFGSRISFLVGSSVLCFVVVQQLVVIWCFHEME